MRILVVSDLHLDRRQLGWVIERADDADLVVVAGDILDVASLTPLADQADIALDFLARVGERSRVAVCSGNHDLDGRDEAGERAASWLNHARVPAVAVDGESFAIDDWYMTVCPWWDGPVGAAALEAQLAAAQPEAAGRPWLWVHHAPPKGASVSWSGRRDLGDELGRALIDRYQPRAVFSGHLHQPPFASGGSWVDRCGATWVFNPGQQIGPTPTRIIIDTVEATATWTSLAGVDTVNLDNGHHGQPLRAISA